MNADTLRTASAMIRNPEGFTASERANIAHTLDRRANRLEESDREYEAMTDEEKRHVLKHGR